MSYSSHLSYKELNQTTNQLAHYLRLKGVKPDTIVGIMLERSIEMIIGILGILKAHGAYLPLDPEYPKERIDYMLKDSGSKILLTGQEITNIHPSTLLPFYPSNPLNLAYIMYTSGSTGKPKGVMVEHRNVVRLVINCNYVELDEETRILQTGAPVFDATTFEMWAALLNGGQLVLVKKEIILDANLLEHALNQYKITTLWLTSPLFNQLIQENCEIFPTLNQLLVGGDVLSPKTINLVRNKNEKLKIINGYGPTENTTFSTTFLIDRDFETNIPIGKPIANSTAYILDRNGLAVPIGIFGELWVGGDGVSRGYLNNPELTAQKFINYKLTNYKQKYAR
jgi:amino acid adenylation domain-containing protein